MVRSTEPRPVYVVGAGLSAGLRFPTVANLLPALWGRIEKKLSNDLGDVIRFHHPDFHPSRGGTYPNIEQLLSEMKANAQLFEASRPATGNFTSEDLDDRRLCLLLALAAWFHELQAKALGNVPAWLDMLVAKIVAQKAQIISFNWDLVLDQLLFEASLGKSSYGFEDGRAGPRLIKPHGSLNWFERRTGQHLKKTKRFSLFGDGSNEVFAFKYFRAPRSENRRYMPLIVPPDYLKAFENPIFKRLWQETVSVLSTASEVTFLGYSLPYADFHARFILRCGFHNQEAGELKEDRSRERATGRAKVTIVDPTEDGPKRIMEAVGWPCDWQQHTVENWIAAGGLE